MLQLFLLIKWSRDTHRQIGPRVCPLVNFVFKSFLPELQKGVPVSFFNVQKSNAQVCMPRLLSSSSIAMN